MQYKFNGLQAEWRKRNLGSCLILSSPRGGDLKTKKVPLLKKTEQWKNHGGVDYQEHGGGVWNWPLMKKVVRGGETLALQNMFKATVANKDWMWMCVEVWIEIRRRKF